MNNDLQDADLVNMTIATHCSFNHLITDNSSIIGKAIITRNHLVKRLAHEQTKN